MGHGFLPIVEKGIGSPDLTGQEVVEGQHLHGPVELQPLVPPTLTEEDVDGVLLKGGRGREISFQDGSFPQFSVIDTCAHSCSNNSKSLLLKGVYCSAR